MKYYRKVHYGFLVLAVAMFAACSSGPQSTDETSKAATEAVSHEDHSGHATDVLLNKGEKWAANIETTIGIEKMSVLVENLPADAQAADFESLGSQLNQVFNTILKECTMTGESHDQLHNYLMPLAQKIKELGSGPVEDRKATTVELSEHLNNYYTYFQ